MRTVIIAGNWKMNKTPKEARVLIDALKEKIDTDVVEVVVCPPFTALADVIDAVEGTKIGVGAQNMHFEDEGAFTGEVSAKMLLDLGVKYVIIGHSERREYFAETDETVNKKLKKAHQEGLVPIVCVGETLEEREGGKQEDIVAAQVKKDFEGVSAEEAEKTVVAYEPIWAIGTGKTASKEQAEEMCKFIRDVLGETYTTETAEKIRIQYGGSVKGSNADELLNMDNIDGALVGGASLKEDFAAIVHYNQK